MPSHGHLASRQKDLLHHNFPRLAIARPPIPTWLRGKLVVRGSGACGGLSFGVGVVLGKLGRPCGGVKVGLR